MEKTNKPSERQIEQRLVAKAKKQGWMPLKFISPSAVGVPDRIIFLPQGRIALVELKAPNKKPRPSQAIMHRRLQELGHKVIIIDSYDKVDKLIVDLEAENQF